MYTAPTASTLPCSSSLHYLAITSLRRHRPSKEVERAKSSQDWQENSSWAARQGEEKVAHGPLLPRFSSPSCGGVQ